MSSQVQEITCPGCGNAVGEHHRIGRIGDLGAWRCDACGLEYHDLVGVADDSAESGQTVRLYVRWGDDGPSDMEIVALKQFVPLLQDLSADEIREELAGNSEYILGAFPGMHARHLAELGRALGLRVDLETPADTTE